MRREGHFVAGTAGAALLLACGASADIAGITFPAGDPSTGLVLRGAGVRTTVSPFEEAPAGPGDIVVDEDRINSSASGGAMNDVFEFTNDGAFLAASATASYGDTFSATNWSGSGSITATASESQSNTAIATAQTRWNATLSLTPGKYRVSGSWDATMADMANFIVSDVDGNTGSGIGVQAFGTSFGGGSSGSFTYDFTVLVAGDIEFDADLSTTVGGTLAAGASESGTMDWPVEVIPTPGTGLLAIGGLLALRRRR